MRLSLWCALAAKILYRPGRLTALAAVSATAVAWAAPAYGTVVGSPLFGHHRVIPAEGQAAQVLIDVPPGPAMTAACTSGTARACDRMSLKSIDAMHRFEGLEPLSLPRNYRSLSLAAQLVAVTNAERVSRGLPTLTGPEKWLDHLAQLGARRLEDPSGPSGRTWASILAAGLRTPLEADYQWMYNDGPGGTNVDCTATNRSQCWAHRENILSSWSGSMGAAMTRLGRGTKVFTELMVARR